MFRQGLKSLPQVNKVSIVLKASSTLTVSAAFTYCVSYHQHRFSPQSASSILCRSLSSSKYVHADSFRILRQSRISSAILQVTKGDLTLQDTDCIVNAANEHLRHGGGLAAAIVRRGGQEQQKLSNQWIAKNGIVACGEGVAVTERTGDLRCKYVLHVVGPRYKDGSQGESGLLRGAIHAALMHADQGMKLKSISIPAISSGIFGYPTGECTEILVQTVIEYLEAENQHLELVRIMDFNDTVLQGIVDAFDETL